MKKNLIKIFAFMFALMIVFGSAVAVSAMYDFELNLDPDNKYKYEEIVFNKLVKEEYEMWLFRYSEEYEYYSEENKTSTPDYVLIKTRKGEPTDLNTFTRYGDYFISENHGDAPFLHEYAIYIPETQDIYDLKIAYDMGIEGIENVFTEAKVGTRFGDVNKDKRITIKDATIIQKYLVGLYEYKFFDHELFWGEDAPLTIFDFNCDRDVSIKDATAIQKYLVGLEY